MDISTLNIFESLKYLSTWRGFETRTKFLLRHQSNKEITLRKPKPS
jgi:hypothetical protein